jgi:hypothetical protein
LFKLDSNGQEAVLYSFTGRTDWFGRFGSSQIPAAMPTPVACTNSIVS